MIVVARISSVLLVQYAFVLCGAEKTLKFKECVFLSYAGMIRGAIALGLAIKAEHYFSEYDFVVASVLALVIVSTLIFGSLMPLVAKCLLDPPKAKTHHSPGIETTQVDGQDSQAFASPEFKQSGGDFSTPEQFASIEQKNKFGSGDSNNMPSFTDQQSDNRR